MDSSAGSWKVSYTGAKESGKFLEGSLILSSNKYWLVILNAHGLPLEGRRLANGEMIKLDSIVRLPSHLVKVHGISFGSSPRCPGALFNNEPHPLKWKASCTSLVDPSVAPRASFLLPETSCSEACALEFQWGGH